MARSQRWKRHSNLARWTDLVQLAVGIWLGFSPWLLGFFDDLPAATWNALLTGIAIIVLATVDLDSPSPKDQSLLALMGLWLVLSPLLLGYAAAWIAAGATMTAGIAMIALASRVLVMIWRARARRRPRSG